MREIRRGYLYGLTAYALWGFFPIYFKALTPARPVEILAHRVLWSALTVGLLLLVMRRWRRLLALRHRPRVLALAGLAALLIGTNWGLYILAVNTSRVTEASLGYFINPLVSVLLGLTVFGERLRRWQWAALGLGALAVVVLTVDYGRPPWIALYLAGSFGSYTMVKKRLGLPPADGLLLESLALAVPALVYLLVLAGHGGGTFGPPTSGHSLLLALSGLVTAVPLLLFAAAANRLPMTGLGVLQYLTPSLQLLLGVALYHEPMPPARLAGFALVWLALAVFTGDALRTGRRAAAGRTRPGPVPAATAGASGWTPDRAPVTDSGTAAPPNRRPGGPPPRRSAPASAAPPPR